ncbi:MAG: glycosyltransferase [Myxococcota bacterium]|nr:glycosyltransferase [Myxococcota bacterium]
MSAAPRLSIVVCTRDRPALLSDALASLEAQTLDGQLWELLVVDNGVGDGTREVVARHPTARLVAEPRTGISHARNTGWRAARGDYVGYLDDDVRAPACWLAAARAVADGPSPPVFGGPYTPVFGAARPVWFRDGYASLDLGPRARWLGAQEFLSGANLFVRRDLLAACGGFDPTLGMRGARLGYGEEPELQLRLRRRGCGVYFDPGLCVEHLVRPEQLRVVWFARRSLAEGRDHERALRAGDAPRPPVWRLLARLGQHAALLPLECLCGALARDRRRHPHLANHLVERAFDHLRGIAAALAGLRRRGPGPREAA